MSFDLSNAKEAKERPPMFLRPGIHERVVIKSVKGELNSMGKPRIEIEMYLETSSPDKATRFRFNMYDKALQYSIDKLVHLGTTVVSRAEIAGVRVEMPDTSNMSTEDKNRAIEAAIMEFGSKLNTLLAGKIVNRLKLVGEEYRKQATGDIAVRTMIGLLRFAEGEEIPREKSRLVYNENNSFDYKKLPTDAVPETDDLP